MSAGNAEDAASGSFGLPLLVVAGGAWSALGIVMNLPGIRQIAGVVCRLIAKYRYRMPGCTAACKPPRS